MPADRPNVLIITTHDTGRHLGCYGVPSVHTPHLDGLAAEGVRFTQYCSTAAYCSPSRGAMMTGRYPQTNGMMGLCHEPWRWRLNDGEKHLSHLLHDAGYYTVLLGHQHETLDVDAQLCFDEHGIHREPDGHHSPCEKVAAGVREFLTGAAASRAPFYLQVGFFETHRPFDFGGAKPDEERGVWVPPYLADGPEVRGDLAAFQGNIRKMDAAVGEVLSSLADSGLEKDTLVIYTTDHGIAYPRAKMSLYDAGIGISLLVRLSGVTAEGRTNDRLLSNVDFTPTVLDLVGVDRPENLDGISFAAAVNGEQGTREEVFAEMPLNLRAVRTERYKLIRNFEAGRLLKTPVDFVTRTPSGNMPYVQLYDLQADPDEFDDRAADPELSNVRADLDARLLDWMRRVDDPILKGPVAHPYYDDALADFRGDGN